MFKTKLLSAAIAALLAGTAYAQLNAPLTAPKPMAVLQPAVQPSITAEAAPVAASAPVAQVAAQSKADAINPFSGKSMSLESRQRELETAKMETSLLEERIKQVALTEDLKSLPLKKSVEAAQATTAKLKEEALQKDGSRQGGTPQASTAAAVATAQAAQVANTPVKPKVNRPAKKAEVKDVPAKVAMGASPMQVAPKVEVTSVLSLGGVRSAVLDVDGSILSVKHGDSTPMGAVEILDSQSVRVGSRVYKVHGSTLARVTISDPKPVDPMKPGAAAPTGATGAPVNVAAGLPLPASFGGSGQPNRTSPALPPLQLPSGVTLLPPANSR